MLVKKLAAVAFMIVGLSGQADAAMMEFLAKGRYVWTEHNQQYFTTWRNSPVVTIRIVFDTEAASQSQDANGYTKLVDLWADPDPFIVSATFSSTLETVSWTSPASYWDDPASPWFNYYLDSIQFKTSPGALRFMALIGQSGSYQNMGVWIDDHYAHARYETDEHVHGITIGGARLRELRDPSAVPLPASAALLPVAIGGLFLARRRRR